MKDKKFSWYKFLAETEYDYNNDPLRDRNVRFIIFKFAAMALVLSILVVGLRSGSNQTVDSDNKDGAKKQSSISQNKIGKNSILNLKNYFNNQNTL